VLGVPRSGTSLLQRILRAQPGFVATAREAKSVWSRFTHPALSDWRGEGWFHDAPNEKVLQSIRGRIRRRCLPAWLWRHLDARQIGTRANQGEITNRLARTAYGTLAFTAWLTRVTGRGRLAEKSVHSACWLNLLDCVFPDAQYIHIVRNPEDTVRSMAGAWLHPSRFFTYQLPVELNIRGYPYTRWNLPLPEGWRAHVDGSLVETVVFQWAALQERLLRFTQERPERCLPLRLEDLARNPGGALERVSSFLDIGWSRHMDQFAFHLPRVNRGDRSDGLPKGASLPDPSEIETELAQYQDLSRAIGY